MALQQLASPDAAVRFLAARGCRALRVDSRRVQPGDGFVAWPGAAHDGRAFVPAALAAGAAAALVEADGAAAFDFDDPRVAALSGLKAATGPIASAFNGHPSQHLRMVATTGTNGKTSTAWWTAQALTALGRRAGVVGTLGIGEPPRVEPTGLTTPDPVTLHAALAGFVAQGFAACAIEASSIGIEENRLDGTQLAVALFTNFTRDHLDYHGSLREYWAAKRRLFDWPGLRAAVLNIDDAQGDTLAGELHGSGLDLWTVSTAGPARLQARNLHYQHGGLHFDVLEAGQPPLRARSALVGDYNASNLLVVIGGLRALGLALADIIDVLPRLTPVPGRLQPLPSAPGLPAVLVDYAHTPDALDKALHAVRPLAVARGGRLWCVFGCGGNRDTSKRPLMGAIAARLADAVVLTSDNPRHERPADILAQILAGVPRRDGVVVLEDRAQAIEHAVRSAAAADVLLLAGKGHEPYQEVAGEQRPFLDADVASRALQARAAAGGGA